MTARLPDWQTRFEDCLAERMDRPFAWGSHDCVLFAADCVDACTGVDPAAHVRGTYACAASAARVMRAHGGLAALAAAALGPEVPPPFTQPGDVGIVISDGRECLAVCIGKGWQVPGEKGLVFFELGQATRVWRISPKVA